jgi:dihydrolipoamide dehydrogenase
MLVCEWMVREDKLRYRKPLHRMKTSLESRQHYQLVVIGSGSGGREASLLGARKGLRTALVEGDKIGGVCFHSGSYAVRALQACAHQFRGSLRSRRFGNKVDFIKATLDEWMVAQSKVSSRLVDSFQAELILLNVDVYQGYGELLDNRTVQVIGGGGSKTLLTADNVIVATGSRPEFYGSSEPRLVNSEELLRIPTLPERLVIVGGGYIGCEFASIYRTLGCAVTVVEKENSLLPGWESEAGQRVGQALMAQGVTVLLNQRFYLDQIKRDGDALCFRPLGESVVKGDLILMATGRKPNARGIGLSALGIDDSSFLKVDERMRLQTPGLYAVGDVNGINCLDSTAFVQASVAINSILGQESRFNRRWTPRCVHTEPAVAAVGWTQQEAEAEGIEHLAVCDTTHLVSDSERSLVEPESTFLKVIVDPSNWHLLGCLVVGDHASTIVNSVTIAMGSGLSVKNLREIPLTQPSAMEALMAMLRKLDEGTPWSSV